MSDDLVAALRATRLELDYLDEGAHELGVQAAWSKLRPT
jgi:hypothetical protein